MDASGQARIEQECRDLIVKFNHYYDHGRGEEAVALFMEDGGWTRDDGRPTRGHAALLANYRRRPTQVRRHIGTTTFITVIDANHAEGVTYFTALHHDPGTPTPDYPLPLHGPASMGEWHDKLVRTPQGWRFAERQTKHIFKRPVA